MRIWVIRLCAALVMLPFLMAVGVAGNLHQSSSTQSEWQFVLGDLLPPSVVSGCLPVLPTSSLLLAPFACSGYVRLPTGELGFVTQAPAQVGPLESADGIDWLAIHHSTAQAVSGWTRVAGTHYLRQRSATQPDDPPSGAVTTRITVVGGAITAIADTSTRTIMHQLAFTSNYATTATSLWVFAPGGSVTIDAGHTLQLAHTPRVSGVPHQIFFGVGVVRVGNQFPSSPHWWGAKGDGSTDDTAAFNLATQADVPWNDGIRRTVLLEAALNYFLVGPVYVRAGQTLTGHGPGHTTIKGDNAAPNANVYGGAGFIDGAVLSDSNSTGIPYTISNLFFSQGSYQPACILATSTNPFLHHLMMTNCGVGIKVASAGDTIISDVFFDQGLVGMVFESAQNTLVTNAAFFNLNYGMIFNGAVIDTQLNNIQMEYVHYVGIEFPSTSTGLRSIHFNGLNIIQNEQFDTLFAMVHGDADDVSEISFTNCTFRNMKSFAVNIASAGGRYSFTNCVFDGIKTNPLYTQSTTAAGIVVEGAILELRNVDMRNLSGPALRISGEYYTRATWDGGKIETDIGGYLPIDLNSVANTSYLNLANIRGPDKVLYGIQGVFPVTHTGLLTGWFRPAEPCPGARLCWYLPYQFGTSYELTVSANVNVAADGAFAKQSTYGLDKSNDSIGAVHTSYLDLTMLHRSAARDNAVLDVQAEFTEAGGGVSVSPLTNFGRIAVSVPNTYTNLTLMARQLRP